MVSAIVFTFLGLFLGWFFVPAPEWAKTLRTKLIEKIPGLASFQKRD